ncbi:MAG: hypothetical protein AAGD00_00460 [Planctomycetota bacterium]
MDQSDAGGDGFGGGFGIEGDGKGGGGTQAQAPEPEAPRASPLIESEALRERAERAEERASALEAEVESLGAALEETRAALDACERRHALDLALVESDVIDIETARLLAELAIDEAETGDVALAVEDVRRRKPFLFRHRSPIASGAMGGRTGGAGALTESEEAERAARSGDRGALLRYLRARRSGN